MRFLHYAMMHFMLHAIEEEQREDHEFILSRYRKPYYNLLPIAQRRLRYNRISRIALLTPHQSSWRKIYSSRNDQAMITLTGFDYDSFEWLNSKV
jgi:hypothetical protein